jgi:hypothetical protein
MEARTIEICPQACAVRYRFRMSEKVGVRSTTTATPPTSNSPGPARPNSDRWLPSVTDRLNQPVSTAVCLLGWIVSIGVFVGLIATFAGPSDVDVGESVNSTWAIAHGQIACAYPSVPPGGEPLAAPLYPLASGAVAAITEIGHGTPFPAAEALGPDCRNAAQAIHEWSLRSGALGPTTWIGCLSWLALMAGVIAWLRASGRGRRGWEPATLVVVAALLPVWGCVQNFFHPQDLLALGLALAAMACARGGRWLMAGVVCALAVLSQQFAFLVAVPLLMVAPVGRKVSFAGAGLLTGAIVVLPLTALTSGRALRAIAIGTGNTPSIGGTVLWETHASGAVAVLVFRVAPIAVSLVLSWWVARRLGAGALQPVPLIALVSVSLGLRLVFEENLITYYFMALMVSLVLLEATRGSVRRTVVAWIAAVTVVVCRISDAPFGTNRWGVYVQNDLIPLFIGGLALLAVFIHLARGHDRRKAWPWLALAGVDLFTLMPGGNAYSAGQVIWFWQMVLVIPGLLLAAQPLWRTIEPSGALRRRGVEQLSSS